MFPTKPDNFPKIRYIYIVQNCIVQNCVDRIVSSTRLRATILIAISWSRRVEQRLGIVIKVSCSERFAMSRKLHTPSLYHNQFSIPSSPYTAIPLGVNWIDRYRYTAILKAIDLLQREVCEGKAARFHSQNLIRHQPTLNRRINRHQGGFFMPITLGLSALCF